MIVQLERSEEAAKAARYEEDFFRTVKQFERAWSAMGYGNYGYGLFKFLQDLSLMIVAHNKAE